MLIKDLKESKEIIAGDETVLRELLRPDQTFVQVRYSLAHAIVKPGTTSRWHSLKTTEVYYILHGEGLMCIDDESAPVQEGQAIYIPPHAKQCIKNTGSSDLAFLCIVDPAWKAEDEEIL